MTDKLQFELDIFIKVCYLTFFTVIERCPSVENDSKPQHSTQVREYVGPAAPFKHDHTHDFNKIAYRIEAGYRLSPRGHAIDGGKQSAHQDEYHHEEKHDKHGLLLRIGIGGYQQTEAQYSQQVNAYEAVHCRYAALGENAVNYP